MGGGEVSDGIKIGVVVAVVAILVSIVIGLVVTSKNNINKSQETLQGNMNNIAEMGFQDYDQTTLTGTQVKASLALFKDQPVAVVVITGANGKDSLTGTNYNALLDGVSAETPAVTLTEIKTGESAYISKLGETEDGIMKYNTVIANTSKAGSKEYIRGSAKFKCNLIKDETGNIIGYCAKQIIAG